MIFHSLQVQIKLSEGNRLPQFLPERFMLCVVLPDHDVWWMLLRFW
jgi:hypothetical protein